MRSYIATTLLLALLVVSARSLPLNTQGSEESSSLSASESNEIDEEQKDDLTDSSNELINPEEASESESVEAPVEESESRIVKRSPDIPDPEQYRDYERGDEHPEAPSVHPTHDEYLEWKLRQPRFRRDTEGDDSQNSDYQDVPAAVENSLDDYAQGCEVMEENSDENNETTYNDYRRKREVNAEDEEEEEKVEEEVEEEREESLPETEVNSDEAEAEADVADSDSVIQSSNEDVLEAEEDARIEESVETDAQPPIESDNNESSIVSAQSDEST